jgi:ankyrin repeat protein
MLRPEKIIKKRKGNHAEKLERYHLTLLGYHKYLQSQDTSSSASNNENTPKYTPATLEQIEALNPNERNFFFNTWLHNRKNRREHAPIPQSSNPKHCLENFAQMTVRHNQHNVIQLLFSEAIDSFQTNNSLTQITVLNKRSQDGFSLAHLAAKYGHVETLKTVLLFRPETFQETVKCPGSRLHGGTITHVAVAYKQYNILDYLEEKKVKKFVKMRLDSGETIAHMIAEKNDKVVFNLLWRLDRAALFDDQYKGNTPIQTAIEHNNTAAMLSFLNIKKSKSDLHPLMTNKTSKSEYLNKKDPTKNIAFYLTASEASIASHVACLRCVYNLYRDTGIFSAHDDQGMTPFDRIIKNLGYTNPPKDTIKEMKNIIAIFYLQSIGDFSELSSLLAKTTHSTNENLYTVAPEGGFQL